VDLERGIRMGINRPVYVINLLAEDTEEFAEFGSNLWVLP